MKKHIILFLAITFLITGCSKSDVDDNRILAEVDHVSIAEVKDFSAFEETELPTETPTEVQTEPITELETKTEPETEPPEMPYSKDYDFSDFTIMQAAFQKDGGITSVDYENTILQDYTTQNRTQTITAKDGNLILQLYADVNSGSSNRKIEIMLTSDTAVDDMRSILLSFDNGITEEKVDRFLNGEYNGVEKAPLIGLKDTLVTVDGSTITVMLEKNEVQSGVIPYWDDSGIVISDYINTTKSDIVLTDKSDLFSDILNGIEFTEVKMLNSTLVSSGITKDATGAVKSRTVDYSAVYITDNSHRYEIDLFSDGVNNPCLTMNCIYGEASEDMVIMNLANHIYQSFYDGVIDVSVSLDRAFSNEHINVEKTTTGFLVKMY